MEHYTIPYQYTFTGTYSVKATSRQEALWKIRSGCWTTIKPITTYLSNDEDIDREFGYIANKEWEDLTPLRWDLDQDMVEYVKQRFIRYSKLEYIDDPDEEVKSYFNKLVLYYNSLIHDL